MARIIQSPVEVASRLASLTPSAQGGVLWEMRPTDLAAHFRSVIEPVTGFDIETLFDVALIDIERRLDVKSDGGVEFAFGPLGHERLTYKVYDLAGDPDTPVAEGATDAFDVPSILDKEGLSPGGDWRVDFEGAIDFEATDIVGVDASPGVRFVLEVDGERILDTESSGTSGKFEPGTAGPLQLKASLFSPPDKPAGPLEVKVVDGAGARDLFELVRKPSDKTIEALVKPDDGTGAAFLMAFEGVDEMSAGLARIAAELGADLQAEATGTLEISEPGTYFFSASNAISDLLIDGKPVAATSAPEKLLLNAGALPFSFTAILKREDPADPPLEITKSGPDTGGATVSLTGARPTVADPLVDLIDAAAAKLPEVADLANAFRFPLNVVEVEPLFDLSLGVDLEFGWDIDFDGLSRTATEQPVDFTLNAPQTIVPGDTFTVAITDFASLAPTTRSSAVEISAIDIAATAQLPETQVKGLGARISTTVPGGDTIETLLGDDPLAVVVAAFDDLAALEIRSDATITLEEAVEAAESLAKSFGVKGELSSLLDVDAFFKGLFSGKIELGTTLEKITKAVKGGDFAGAINEVLKIIKVGKAIPAGENAPKLVTLETTEGVEVGVSGTELVPLATAAALIGPGEGRFVTAEFDGIGELRIPVAEIDDAAEKSGLKTVFADLRAALNGGVEVIDGLKLSADIPFNQVFTSEGFSPGETTPRGDFTRVISSSSVDLLSVDVDVEKVAREAAIAAVDEALQTPGLPPKAVAALVAARVALAVQPILVETIEEGASGALAVQPAPLIGATLQAFAGLFETAVGGLDDLLGVDLPFPDLTQTDWVALVDDEAALSAFVQTLLQPLEDGIAAVPDVVVAALEDGAAAVGSSLSGAASVLDAKVVDSVDAVQSLIEALRGTLDSADGAADKADQFAADIETLAAAIGDELVALSGAITDALGANGTVDVTIAGAAYTAFEGGLATFIDDALAVLPGGFPGSPRDIAIAGLQTVGFRFDTSGDVDLEGSLFGGLFSTLRNAADDADEVAGDLLNALNVIEDIDDALEAAVTDASNSVSEVRDLLGDILSDLDGAATQISQALSGLSQALSLIEAVSSDILDEVEALDDLLSAGVDLNFDALFDGVAEGLSRAIASAAQGATLEGDLDLNLQDFLYKLDLELTQTTFFNPAKAKIEYTYGDETVVTGLGTAAEFDVPDDPAVAPNEVTARVLMDGAYDYLYTVRPKHDLDFTYLGFSLAGEVTIGDNAPVPFGNPFDPAAERFDYALVKTTDTLPGTLEEQFDEALIEIPADLVIEEVQTRFVDLFTARAAELIESTTGIAPIAEVPSGEIGLFRINGVDASERDDLGFFPVGAVRALQIEGFVPPPPPPPPPPVWEVRQVQLDTNDTLVSFDRTFVDPVVIAKAPSEQEADPAAVRIRDVTPTSAVLALQEPGNEDGIHGPETVSLLVVEAGTHRLPDGTIVQAGTLESGMLSSAGFEEVSFHHAFGATPSIFTQVQTTNGADFVVTRQRDAQTTHFDVTMQEEEANNGGAHMPETIGWVAMDRGTGGVDGTTYEIGTTGDRVGDTAVRQDFGSPFADTPALLTSLSTFDGIDPSMLRLPSVDAAGFDVRVQEDTSLDAEVFHTGEAVDWMAVSGPGSVTGMAARQIGEVMTVELNNVPQTLEFSATYKNPVVIAQGPSFRGADAAAVRLREVDSDSVTLSIQEPNMLDGFHASEAVTVFVIEAGRHVLADGTRIEAGTLTSSLLSPQGFEQVDFATDFAERPAIFSQIQSDNGADFAVTRQDNTSADGVQLTMQEEEELNGGFHMAETLGWVAVETGSGLWSGIDWEAGTTARVFGDAGARHTFASDFDAAPNVVGAISSFAGIDPAMLRFDVIDAAGFDATVQEDRSADAEVRHAPETLDYIAFAGVGALTGFELDPV